MIIRPHSHNRGHPLVGSGKEATASRGARERAGFPFLSFSHTLMPAHPGFHFSGVALVLQAAPVTHQDQGIKPVLALAPLAGYARPRKHIGSR